MVYHGLPMCYVVGQRDEVKEDAQRHKQNLNLDKKASVSWINHFVQDVKSLLVSVVPTYLSMPEAEADYGSFYATGAEASHARHAMRETRTPAPTSHTTSVQTARTLATRGSWPYYERNKCLTSSNNKNFIRIVITSFLLLPVRHWLLLAMHL